MPSAQRTSYELLDIDTQSHEKLSAELERARRNQYRISVGRRDDRAYESPARIKKMYNYLAGLDEKLATHRKKFVAEGYGKPKGLHPLMRKVRGRHELNDKLEPMRDLLLFAPEQTNSRPWHNQRGRAAALLTIVSAHDLLTPESKKGAYRTMSGPLDARVLDYVFDSRAPRLLGVSVRDALVMSGRKYGRLSEKKAEAEADKRLADLKEFIEMPNSREFAEVVRYCIDSLGIRARKREVHERIREHILDKPNTSREFIIMSYGSGTALPMLEVIRDLKENHKIRAKLLLLDQDPLALASSACLADDMGVGDQIEIHWERLFSRLGSPLRLQKILKGRRLDVAEDSGLREYLPDMIYKKLTRESWAALRRGGLMTTGNMNTHRPQSEFIHGAMGWIPFVRMRTINQSMNLHVNAGIPRYLTEARVTYDGVYTLYFTVKPSTR